MTQSTHVLFDWTLAIQQIIFGLADKKKKNSVLFIIISSRILTNVMKWLTTP